MRGREVCSFSAWERRKEKGGERRKEGFNVEGQGRHKEEVSILRVLAAEPATAQHRPSLGTIFPKGKKGITKQQEEKPGAPPMQRRRLDENVLGDFFGIGGQ